MDTKAKIKFIIVRNFRKLTKLENRTKLLNQYRVNKFIPRSMKFNAISTYQSIYNTNEFQRNLNRFIRTNLINKEIKNQIQK